MEEVARDPMIWYDEAVQEPISKRAFKKGIRSARGSVRLRTTISVSEYLGIPQQSARTSLAIAYGLFLRWVLNQSPRGAVHRRQYCDMVK